MVADRDGQNVAEHSIASSLRLATCRGGVAGGAIGGVRAALGREITAPAGRKKSAYDAAAKHYMMFLLIKGVDNRINLKLAQIEVWHCGSGRDRGGIFKKRSKQILCPACRRVRQQSA